jgi:hypothetical protein
MQIDLYEEIKKAIKDALTEWHEENKTKMKEIHSVDEQGSNLLTVKQFVQKHPFTSVGSLYHRFFCREYNKFDNCCSKIGRKILIKEKEALEYFANPPPESNWTYDKKKYGEK